MLRSSRVYVFYKKGAFQAFQNVAKVTEKHSKARLETLLKIGSGRGVFP